MDAVQELVPLAKELLAPKRRGRLLRLYVLGGVLALVGALLGLVETVCGPFAAAGRLREEEAAAAELRDVRDASERRALRGEAKPKPREALGSRALAHRQHAS